MVQNKQYPDILEGDATPQFVQNGLLYPVRRHVASDPQQPDPDLRTRGDVQGTAYGIPFTTSTRALFYNNKLFQQAGITAAPHDLGRAGGGRREDQGAGQDRLRPAAGLRGGAGRDLLWTLGNGGGYTDASGKWAINSPGEHRRPSSA